MADIERQRIEKAREVTTALKEGRLPTTAQAVDSIDKISQDRTLTGAAKDNNLSLTGQKVMADTERLLDDTRKVMQQTIPNNELQNALYYGGVAASRQRLSTEEGQAAADQLVQAGSKAAQLAKMVVTSSEFRTLLNDISAIVQDIVKSNVVDASDDLARNDDLPDPLRNAMANTRDQVQHKGLQGATEDGKIKAQQSYQQTKQASYDQTDAQGRKLQDVGESTRRTAGDSIVGGASLRETVHNVVNVVADKAEQHLPEDQVNRTSESIRNQAAKVYTGEQSAQGIKNQALAQGQGLKDSAMSKLQDPKLRETGTRVARKLVDMPQDRRDELLRKIKAVARSIQAKPEFKGAVDDLFSLLSSLFGQAQAVTSIAVDKAAEAPNDPNQINASRESKLAIANAKQLIENIANGRSLDPLIDSTRSFADAARQDDELRSFWTDFGSFVTRIVREPGYVDRSNYDQEARDFVERGRRSLDGYSYYTQKISYELNNVAHELASNKATKKLQADASTLMADLFLDERGNPAFKPELLRDLAKLIPNIADRLAYLPIPRVEVDDGTYHFVFDNIILHSTIVPKYVHLTTDTTVDATKKDPQAQVNSYVVLEISKIEASARDIAWLFNKHSGFWKAGDVGLADFDIKGEGLSVRMKITPGAELGRAAPAKDVEGRFLHADDIKATLHNLDLRLHDSHHDFLYKIAKPILNNRAKKSIEKAVEDSLRDLVSRLDGQMAYAAQGAAGISVKEGQKPVQGIPEWGSRAYNT